MNPPLVSVNMTTYNALTHIDQAISSILNQTYTNIELIIVNADHRMHNRLECWASKDERIKLYHHYDLPISPARTLALQLSNGKYIAIHDADDFSDVTRFEKQVNYLEKHPNIGGVGSYIRIINDDKDNTTFDINVARLPFLVRFYAYFECPIGHGTVMYRSSVIHENNLKYRGYANGFPEDYDLLLQLLNYTDLANIPEYLYTYRCGIGNSCNDKSSNIRLSILVPIIKYSAMYKRYRCIIRDERVKSDIIPYIVRFARKERLSFFKILIICVSVGVFMIKSRKIKRRIIESKKRSTDHCSPIGLDI